MRRGWAVACAAVALALSPRASGQTRYTATTASIDQHPPAPEWFQDGKLGIWFHWGVHTTPQFYSEWYPHFIYDKSNGGREVVSVGGSQDCEGSGGGLRRRIRGKPRILGGAGAGTWLAVTEGPPNR